MIEDQPIKENKTDVEKDFDSWLKKKNTKKKKEINHYKENSNKKETKNRFCLFKIGIFLQFVFLNNGMRRLNNQN
jgi:hypothetical protein